MQATAIKPNKKKIVSPIPAVFNVRTLADALWVTGNSKTGLSFDLNAQGSCPGMTEACTAKLALADGTEGKMITCYAMQGLYLWGQPKYANNKLLIETALSRGMSYEQVADAIYLAIRRKSKDLRIIRLHGSGDIFSVAYCKVLIALANKLASKGMRLYGYTRSYVIPTLLPGIIALARLDNVDLNLSADRFNYESAAEVYLSNPGFQRIACMQEADAPWIDEMINAGVRKSNLILFPIHKGKKKDADGKTVMKMVDPLPGKPVCPAMIDAFKDKTIPACIQCKAICHN